MSAEKIDVFAQVPAPAKYLPANVAENLDIFKHIKWSMYEDATREYVNKLFATYTRLRLADPHLLGNLPREFMSRVFEMWIAGTLDEWDWLLNPPTMPAHGLDFWTPSRDRKLWIEATAVTRGSVRSPFMMHKLVAGESYGGGHNFPALPLRYLGALDEKQHHYERSLKKGHLAPEDSYCVAICGGLVHMHGPWDSPEPVGPIIVNTLCGPDV